MGTRSPSLPKPPFSPQPEEIAPAYVLFASGADASCITGAVLTALSRQTVGA